MPDINPLMVMLPVLLAQEVGLDDVPVIVGAVFTVTTEVTVLLQPVAVMVPVTK